MKPDNTMRKRCSFCRVLVLVTHTSPNPKSRIFLNGYWIRSMDENFNEHNSGYICESCLDRFVFQKSMLSFGGFGKVEERFESCEAFITDNFNVFDLMEG